MLSPGRDTRRTTAFQPMHTRRLFTDSPKSGLESGGSGRRLAGEASRGGRMPVGGRGARRGWSPRLAAVVLVASASAFTMSLRPQAAGAAGTAGATTGAIPEQTAEHLTTYPGISSPLGIAVGPDGALWFTNTDDNSIGRITTGGINTNYTGIGIDDPTAITTGPDGALWFTNAGNNSIGRITTKGT